MTIEFHTPYGKVTEKLVSFMRNELLGLSHSYKDISRAEVFLKEDRNIITPENKICDIRLTVFGDDLHIHVRMENFKNSVKEAISELKKMVRQQVKKLKEPPDKIISTVRV